MNSTENGTGEYRCRVGLSPCPSVKDLGVHVAESSSQATQVTFLHIGRSTGGHGEITDGDPLMTGGVRTSLLVIVLYREG
jgi:hypothetical protein